MNQDSEHAKNLCHMASISEAANARCSPFARSHHDS